MKLNKLVVGLITLMGAGALTWAPAAASAAASYEYDHITMFGDRSFIKQYTGGAQDLSYSDDGGWSLAAQGYWQPKGELFLLRDADSDGSGVGIYWRIPSTGRSGLIHNTGGSDNGWGFKDKDFGENKNISIKLGKCSRAGGKSCKTPQQYTWGSSITLRT